MKNRMRGITDAATGETVKNSLIGGGLFGCGQIAAALALGCLVVWLVLALVIVLLWALFAFLSSLLPL